MNVTTTTRTTNIENAINITEHAKPPAKNI